jgi:hypothetical protein
MATTPKQPVQPRHAAVKPLVVKPRGAKQMYGGISNEKLYDKIKTGAVDSYLDGRSRLITVASIEADVARGVAAAAAKGFERARGADHDRLGRRTQRPRKPVTAPP